MSALPRFGLDDAVISMLGKVFARYPEVTEVRVYGSRAKGNFGHGSDIDLSIMDKAVSDQQLLRIENDIDELPMPYTVDLLLFHKIENPALTDHILRVGKLFYPA